MYLSYVKYYAIIVIFIFIGACTSAQKGGNTNPEEAKKALYSLPSEIVDKKVALIAIDAESTQQKITEVSLINQLLKNGSFHLIPKQEVEKMKQAPQWVASHEASLLAQNLGADFALLVQVTRFDVNIHEGFNKEKKYDSLLAKEQGDKGGESIELIKVKSMHAVYEAKLTWIDTKSNEVKHSIAYAEDTLLQEQKNQAIHFPPRMRFMETLANKAFEKLFSEKD